MVTWLVAWLGGTVLAVALIGVVGADVDDLSTPELFVVTSATWAAFVAGLVIVGRRYGSGRFTVDYAVSFRPIDVVGVPLGIVTQVALVPLLYVPLRAWWPDTFSSDELAERAEDLVDNAGGAMTVLLALTVVVGAPIVEELVYRGLLQRSAMSAVGAVPGLVLTAVWFAAIHQSVAELPGLFVAGLVFGGCVLVTGRLGAAMVTHAAFNATGLLIVIAG